MLSADSIYEVADYVTTATNFERIRREVPCTLISRARHLKGDIGGGWIFRSDGIIASVTNIERLWRAKIITDTYYLSAILSESSYGAPASWSPRSMHPTESDEVILRMRFPFMFNEDVLVYD